MLATLLFGAGCSRTEAPQEAGRAGVAARAQAGKQDPTASGQNKIPRVAMLLFGPKDTTIATATSSQPPLMLVRDRLRVLGYVEGKTIVFEEHFADGDPERMERIAQSVAASTPDVIVSVAATATLAARRATSTIPIVMAHAGDPVGSGLAASLSHPGGNVTGTTSMVPDLGAKQLEILRQLIPRLGSLGVLLNSTNPGHVSQLALLSEAARSLGVGVAVAEVSRPEDIDGALARLREARPDALFVMIEPMLFQQRAQVLEFLQKNGLPASFDVGRQVVREGGLMAFGPVLSTHYSLVADHVDKILKGAKPGDLPIHQPTEFALVVNLKTAATLGLTVPQTLLLRADEVVR